MAGRPLGTYLLQIVMYKDALDHHLKAPKENMQKFGLSKSNQKLVLEGNLEQIARQVEEEFGKRPGDFVAP